MGPGVDPHAYRQTRTDIQAMLNADLVLSHGLFLEAQMEDFLIDLARRVPVSAVGETVPQDLLLGHDDYADKFDPHVWMDPAKWQFVLQGVTASLSDVAPDLCRRFCRQLGGLCDRGRTAWDICAQRTGQRPRRVARSGDRP